MITIPVSSFSLVGMCSRPRACVPAGDDVPYYKKARPYVRRWPHLYCRVHLTKGMTYMKGSGSEILLYDERPPPRRRRGRAVVKEVEGILRSTKEDTSQVGLDDTSVGESKDGVRFLLLRKFIFSSLATNIQELGECRPLRQAEGSLAREAHQV